MAHSFIQAHDNEMAAFEHFAASNAGNVVLLLDTYDIEAAAAKVVRLARALKRAAPGSTGAQIAATSASMPPTCALFSIERSFAQADDFCERQSRWSIACAISSPTKYY